MKCEGQSNETGTMRKRNQDLLRFKWPASRHTRIPLCMYAYTYANVIAFDHFDLKDFNIKVSLAFQRIRNAILPT